MQEAIALYRWLIRYSFGSTSACARGRTAPRGVDAVQLLETPAGWRIVSIADTSEPTGCPPREAPR